MSQLRQFFAGSKFTFNWKVKVEAGSLPNLLSTDLKLCRHSICFLYGFPLSYMKRVSAKIKLTKSADLTSIKTARPWDHSTYFEDVSMDDIKQIYDANPGVDAGK